jgi:hypothetical protein
MNEILRSLRSLRMTNLQSTRINAIALRKEPRSIDLGFSQYFHRIMLQVRSSLLAREDLGLN